MCRCCQSCWEDLYWSCFEEKFCYDESIANYNPDDDEEFMASQIKNGVIVPTQSIVNNNFPVCNQPQSRSTSGISSKIHEEDYRREIQTNAPILAPEILQVFQNSQIFQEHQPKLTRIQTKPYLTPGIHGTSSTSKESDTKRETDEEKLIKRLEGFPQPELEEVTCVDDDNTEKKIKFTIAPESSPETRRSTSPKKFEAIIEEDGDKDEVILRPRLTETLCENSTLKVPQIKKQPLRNVQSVPYFSVRTASETDIFSITGSDSFSRISMTPEVPSISYSNLPKNYEDTPTIEGYKASVSLYSIQTANEARASNTDYSMPRYFRRSQLLAQSTDNLSSSGEIPRDEHATPKRYEKSHRLKVLRGSLPPLMIHTVRNKKDEGKQVD